MELVKELRIISQKHILNKKLKLKVTDVEGEIIEGYYWGYTQAIDNDPEIASIEVFKEDKVIELYENEIRNIEVLTVS